MKFSQMVYKRPNLDEVEKKVGKLLSALTKLESFEEHNEIFLQIIEIEKDIQSQETLVYIRHSLDSLDSFYEKENDFWDENRARFTALRQGLNGALVESPYLQDYRQLYGDHFIDRVLLEKKTFKKEIMAELVEEGQWTSKYQKLMASVQIPFKGRDRTLPEMEAFLEDPDRGLRRNAGEAIFGFFQANQEEFDQIYDKLVKLRHTIARKLGYKNFIQLGYDRLARTDYGQQDVAAYREGVRKFLVPLVEEIYQEQRRGLGLEKLYYYDLAYEYPGGMPNPKGDSDFIIAQAEKMYNELSAESGSFFKLLLEKEVMDLVSKKAKAPGGYCTFIENYGLPFIFANFNGTLGDVNVLTHEFGHAFQAYSAKDLPLPTQRFPGMEAAEIHSMGMEFISWPWMENFFGEDSDKFFYSQAAGALSFIPYGVLVDHFQHEVYENPQMTPEARRAKWRELEKIYMPWKDYNGQAYLEEGGFWQKQGHIYEVPFYYIDYSLAQIVALEILKRSRKNQKQLWEDYKAICKVGGSLSFLGILELGNFQSPFDPKVVEETVAYLKDFLETFDRSSF